MTTEIGEYYSLMPTKFPELCTTSLSPEQNQTFATIEYLYRNGIISTWPNFTNCLPQCGICTSFATDHTYMIYNLVMIGLLLPFISLCGLIGNSLSAFIYSRPRMRSSTNLYFCCLACSDIAVCLPEKCKRFFSRVGCFQFVSAFVIIFSISYNVPRFFENIAFECWHSKFDSNSMEVCPTPLRYNDT
uniref:G-protein coupled receptors family 1 profile domain-containing protein n=1 Tax=Panagrolaimus davidi TaxID=227884 RepID=A0A914QSA7_9BILA